MGYRGMVKEQGRACDLRAEGWTMPEIAEKLGVSRSSVSLWTRDVPYTPRRPPRSGYDASKRAPNKLQVRKQEEIDRLIAEGAERIGTLSDRDLLIAGTALYAGEGSKTPGEVRFANTDPRMIALFLQWFRRFFVVDERRLRLKQYLHEGLDLEAANEFWAEVTCIPIEQFRKPYRAVPDPSIRKAKHVHGCPSVCYGGMATHRRVMGLVTALLTSEAPFRGSSTGGAGHC